MLSRRQFLHGLASSAMLVGLGPAGGLAQGRRPASSMLLGPEEAWANSICQLCPSACGLRVRLVNGHPVTVTGNPLHPVNRGGLCGRGAAGLQLYYDPDRLAGPMRADVDARGGFAPVAWKDAIAEVGDRVQAAMRNGPGRVAVIRGDGRDVAAQMLGRLVHAAGSGWTVDETTPAEHAADQVLRQTHGASGRLVPDLTNVDFLLSADSGLLESASATMTLQRGFAAMRAAGGTFAHAGPRMGVTGSKADMWLPIRPSTAGVFALGVAHMLIKEGYERESFLRAHARGYDDWVDEIGTERSGVRSWILRYFSPQRVAEITDVPPERIIRVARAFGGSERPLAIGPVEGMTSLQPFDAMAVHALNVIAGTVNVPGGVLLASPSPLTSLDRVGASEAADGVVRHEESRTIEDLTRWVLQSKDPPIEVLFVHDADPLLSSESGEQVAEALHKIPLVVSTSPVVTDTVQVADIVLPDSLWLERGCDAVSFDEQARPVVSTSGAAAPPRADTRHTADVVLALASQIGGEIATHFPWKGYEDIIAGYGETLYASGVGDTFSSAESSEWTQLLERSGWRTPSYASAGDLRKLLYATGGWWDSAHAHGEWRRLVPAGDHRIDLRAAQFPAQPPAAPALDQERDGNLFLYVYTEPSLTMRPGGSLPYLQDISSPLAEVGWVSTAELNPETAHRLAIEHGDAVVIRSESGEAEARVVLSPGIRPDVVAIHTGGGRVYGGRYDAGIGSNPLQLVAGALADGARPSVWGMTQVRLEKRA